MLTAAGCSTLDPLQGSCEWWEQLTVEAALQVDSAIPRWARPSFLERPIRKAETELKTGGRTEKTRPIRGKVNPRI